MLRAFLIAATTLAGIGAVHAADQPAKPEWQKVAVPNGEVVIFGNVARAGYYALPDKRLSLKQLVISAGAPEGREGVVIQLRRHIGKDQAKVIEVKMESLVSEGNIALEPNDVVQVLSTKAVG
ncbi:MAG TPA: hypothetical protein VH475_05625 [Tepidisphaeraceae bacterium]|jgi:protein involved in polysaccharide export with SLBB domain